jgi:lysophospholipase L1-like esterase
MAARSCRAILLIALVFAIFSGTPLSLFLAIPLIALVIALAFFLGEPAHPRLRAAIVSATVVLGLFATVPEAIHLYRRPPPAEMPRTLLVLGDSLTSGDFGESETWTKRVNTDCGIEIIDRSAPSETTSSAAKALENEVPAADAVFIELGGNDMLEGRSADDFERDFASVLSLLRAADPDQPVLILEFPVLPGKWGFAAAQRGVATRYDAELIPKRVLAAVLTDSRNTFDGLHLNDRGHAELARRITPWLACPHPAPAP